MTVAFEAAAGWSRALRRAVLAAHLTGLAGVAAIAQLLAASGRPWLAVASALVGCAGFALGLWCARRAAQSGRLSVTATGAARWQRPGGPIEPLEPLRWLRLGTLVWIDARAGERRVRLLLGRDRLPDDATWRRLLAWLVWLGRGGRSETPLQNAPSGRS